MKLTKFYFNSDLAPIEDRSFEIVERKGIGHPDTLADGVSEAVSCAYSAHCLREFGVILHQTLDKIMFIGGLGKFGFGIGDMVRPWHLILNGRLTSEFAGEKIPFREIAAEAAKTYLREVVPKFDAEKWLRISFFTSSFSKNPRWFKPQTIEDVPDAINPYANDTSTCIGYWPLSTTEKLTLLMESYFYNNNRLPKFSFIGQDIKVMCVRREKRIQIVMCVPFFSKEIPNAEAYLEHKNKIKSELFLLAEEFVKGAHEIELFINTQDEMVKNTKKGIGHYFVVSGSALDSGEEGVVGRGNRSRGIISSIRPSSMEAICGKNPVYYVGKIYNYLADLFAKKIAEKFECECQVYIFSRNSDPLAVPYNILVETTRKINERQAIKIIQQELGKGSWSKEIVEDRPFVPIPGGGNGVRI